jgi:hypothetical protein
MKKEKIKPTRIRMLETYTWENKNHWQKERRKQFARQWRAEDAEEIQKELNNAALRKTRSGNGTPSVHPQGESPTADD